MTDTAHPNCAAHSCPMLGCMSRSTTGSTEWYCGAHFGAEGKRWEEIMAELQRLGWLVSITRELHAHGNARGWSGLRAAADVEITVERDGFIAMATAQMPYDSTAKPLNVKRDVTRALDSLIASGHVIDVNGILRGRNDLQHAEICAFHSFHTFPFRSNGTVEKALSIFPSISIPVRDGKKGKGKARAV